MTTPSQYPLYIKIANIAIGLLAFFYILFIGKDIVLPLIYATIIAILLNPVVNWLTVKGMNRVLAIFVALILTLLVLSGMIYFIGSKLAVFSDTFPQFKEKFGLLLKLVLEWISQTFNIKSTQLYAWVDQAKSQGLDNSSAVIGKTITVLGRLLAVVFLVPVYILMILFYKTLLLEFISQLFPRERHDAVVEVLTESKALVQSYLIGLLLEVVIVASLNIGALLWIGVQYAILLGIIGALLNMIPYIGGLVAISLTVLVALSTQSPEAAGLVVLAYILIQLIDNNFLMPKIVASKVKLNALVSIVAVLVFGAMWGVPGMFLAIPLTAIVKVIFDRVEPLKPFGFLLGDNMPPIGKTIFHFRKRKKVKEA